MAKQLPPHDQAITVPAGDGWEAVVAFKGSKLVGLTVAPVRANSIPETIDLRNVHISEARAQVVANAQKIDSAAALAQVQAERRKLGGRRTARENDQIYWIVAHCVLAAQELRVPRYTHVRQVLKGMGYDLGKNPEGVVKDLVRRATEAGYLAPVGSGQKPREAGPRLAETSIYTDSVTLHPDGRVVPGKRRKGRKR